MDTSNELVAKVKPKKAPATPAEALAAAPTVEEVLARPHDYAKWYKGPREEALANV